MTTGLENVPGFMLDRAINALEAARDKIDHEISQLRTEKNGRDWKRRKRRQTERITRDLIERGMTDENQARIWLMENGHSWKYAGEILSAMQTRIEAEKKAAREVEIFRRWNIGKEKKTALAREFGLSRSSIERICRKYAESDGLKAIFAAAYHKKLRPSP